MTESSGGSVIAAPDGPMGYAGGPVANCKIKLRDIPESGWLHTNFPPKGEVCFKGTSIMPGYFKNPEKTAEAIKDGWLHTGDVAEVQPDGSIKIVDRAKNIFKLTQGEYIAPDRLEGVYVKSSWVM
jgi:long-chain acyl-CoA synthetase